MKKCVKCGCKFHHKTCPYYKNRFSIKKFKGQPYIFTRLIEILILILFLYIILKKQPILADISPLSVQIPINPRLKPNLSIYEAKLGFFHFILNLANDTLKKQIVLFRILTYQISPHSPLPTLYPISLIQSKFAPFPFYFGALLPFTTILPSHNQPLHPFCSCSRRLRPHLPPPSNHARDSHLSKRTCEFPPFPIFHFD